MRQIFCLLATLIAMVWCQLGAVAAPQETTALIQSSQPQVHAAQLPILDQLAATTKKKNKKRKSCPAGQNRDPETGQCFSCSHNDHFDIDLGKCVPCQAGFHEEVLADDNGEEQNVCVADKKKSKKKKAKSCPEGQSFTNGKCRTAEFPAEEQCPEGQNADPKTGVCFSCSHNDHFDPAQGICVPCKEGFHVEGEQCVAD